MSVTARTRGSDSWAPHHAAWLSLILWCSLIAWADWTWENYESAEELWLILRLLQLFHYFCSLLQVSSQGRAREVIREGSPVLLAWGPCVWGLGGGGLPQTTEQRCDGRLCWDQRHSRRGVFLYRETHNPLSIIFSFCFRLLFSALKPGSLLRPKVLVIVLSGLLNRA